jgi:disulfide bond formation protein DsbB
MLNLKKEFYLKIVFLISFIAITSAFYLEYILGHKPCNLCLVERIPYALSLFIILLNYKFKEKEKLLILLLILIFIFSLIISTYHFGIEQGFFEESMICKLNTASEILTKEELLIELNKITISCKDVTFKIFGFSLTTLNMVLNLILIILLLKIYIYEKN